MRKVFAASRKTTKGGWLTIAGNFSLLRSTLETLRFRFRNSKQAGAKETLMRCPRDEQTGFSVNRGSHVLWQRPGEPNHTLRLCIFFTLSLLLPFVTNSSGLAETLDVSMRLLFQASFLILNKAFMNRLNANRQLGRDSFF